MKKNTLFWLFSHYRRRIPAILLMMAAQVGNSLLSVFFALGTRGVIDGAITGDREVFLRACLHQAAIILGILFCVTLMRHLRERLRADLDWDWKRRLLHGLLHGDYAAVSSYHSAELINRLNNDVNKLDEGILTLLPTAVSMITRVAAAVVVLGVLDVRFTVVIALLGAAALLATGVMRRRLKDLNKRVSHHDGVVSGFLQETLEKLLMVQAMDVSAEVERRADVLLEERYRIQRKRKNISLITNTGTSVMYYGAGFLALIWCSSLLLQGKMSFGSLTAVMSLVSQLQAPFTGLTGVLPQYVTSLASAERLMELEQIQGEPAPLGESPGELYRGMDSIRAEHVSFAYDRNPILTDTDFTLPKGAFAVITGPSGIGKSTLLKLLLGVYRPAAGRLCIDGQKGTLTLDRSTRRLFAYVPQGNLLLSGTLRENLTIIKPDATDVEIAQALHISTMEDFLPQLPLGLDTVLGESGAGLSEGQAQRLAIARAVLGGAPVLLLDECTSALDAKTEETVLRRLQSLPDRTCIAVTHRPAAVEMCDWELKVCDGKIHAIQK